jgi:hypothetical protein
LTTASTIFVKACGHLFFVERGLEEFRGLPQSEFFSPRLHRAVTGDDFVVFNSLRCGEKASVDGWETAWTKQDASPGEFMDVKKSEKKFKGVRRERSKAKQL